MWFWIISAAVIVAIVGGQWLLAPYARRRGSRRATTTYTTDVQIAEAQARSIRNQSFPT